MDDDAPPLVKDSAADRSLVEDLRLLAADGKTLLEAELAYQKSRAAVAGDAAKGIAGWGALALALVFFALMALVLGLLLGLTKAIGPWAATAVVTLGVLLAALLCGLVVRARWKRTASLLSDAETPA